MTFPGVWAGRDYAAGDTTLRTYNATPSFAYKISDMISVGVGVQIQYASADLSTGPTPFIPGIGFVPLNAELSGHGWGYGFTAGVTLTPTPTTTIGIGYRSFIDQKIDGALTSPLGAASVGTTLNLPDTVSIGLRQRLTPAVDLAWPRWNGRTGAGSARRM